MNDQEREEILRLCERIVEEKDRATFLKLIIQLNELLSRQDFRKGKDKNSN
jgi:hypothetical protein